MTDYPTSKYISVMYRRTAKSGGSYFSGKLDGARITLVKSSKKTDDDQEIWNLLQDEIPERKPDPRARTAGGDPDFRRQVDDEIPSER